MSVSKYKNLAFSVPFFLQEQPVGFESMCIFVFMHKLGFMRIWEYIFEIFTCSWGNLAEVNFYPKGRWQTMKTLDRVDSKSSALDWI